MPQPQAYERQTDFTERDGDDTDHAALNQELDAAALSIEGIRDNLALIQKDDGGLKNAVVTPESLAPETFTALQGNVAGAVAAAETAAQSALTSATTANTARDQAVAAAAAAQTSQTAAALNAGTASTAAGAASASQTAAAASAGAALVSENNADASEAAALGSANAAAVSAAAALTDKTAAAASAAAALTSANNADTSEAAALASQNAAATSATNSGNSATAAAASQAAAAASAATVNLPVSLVGKLLNFLRVKADESGYEHRTAAQTRSDIGAASALEFVGAVAYFPATTPPTGWLKFNGALLSRATYANLYAYAVASGNMAASDGAWSGAQFSPGDGATTFRIGDGRGEFPRGWDDGRGVDAARAIGSYQASQNLAHTHNTVRTMDGTSLPNGAGAYAVAAVGGSASTNSIALTSSDGGTEARSRNIALLACIKY